MFADELEKDSKRFYTGMQDKDRCTEIREHQQKLESDLVENQGMLPNVAAIKSWELLFDDALKKL